MSKAEQIVSAAESQLGSPYVYGTWGQKCTPSLRRRYAGYSPKHKDKIYKTCPVLSGKQSKCTGCKYDGRLAFDCRGFTHWCLEQVDISITGQAVGTQWRGDNWVEKGDKIGQMLVMNVRYEDIEIVSKLSETDRGESGFGSTGVR